MAEETSLGNTEAKGDAFYHFWRTDGTNSGTYRDRSRCRYLIFVQDAGRDYQSVPYSSSFFFLALSAPNPHTSRCIRHKRGLGDGDEYIYERDGSILISEVFHNV